MTCEEIEGRLRSVMAAVGCPATGGGIADLLDRLGSFARHHQMIHRVTRAVWRAFSEDPADPLPTLPRKEALSHPRDGGIIAFCPGATLDLKIGDATFPEGERIRIQAAGRGISLARAMKALAGEAQEAPPMLCGWIGGEAGSALAALLHEEGIRACLHAIPGETRICLYGPRGRVLYDPGPPVTEAEVAAQFEASIADLSPYRCVVLAGSIPPRLAPDFYRRLLDRLPPHPDRTIVVDTYPDLLRPLLEGAAALPTLMTPNIEEFAGMTGIASSFFRGRLDRIVHHALPLLERGVETLIVTLDREGALLLSRKGGHLEIYTARPPQIVQVDTQGAGDTFLGAYLHAAALLDWPAAEALRFAAAAGTISAGKPGTGGIESYEEVIRFMPLVEICRLA